MSGLFPFAIRSFSFIVCSAGFWLSDSDISYTAVSLKAGTLLKRSS